MSHTIQAVRGMNDILPGDAHFWEFFETTVVDWLKSYGYRAIRLPIVESTDLFVRSIGEVTDIVEKEMYTFIDALNGESLTLRPEGTAGCARAVMQHNLSYNAPQRLYYMGPMFRHERPQKGRYRQFHQVGVEAFGFPGPDMDVEHIVMTSRLWKRLGLTDVRLQINTLGDSAARRRHRQKLVRYLERRVEQLDEDAKRRLHANPLRILDSKNPAMQEMIESAPRLMDDLEEDALRHFEQLQQSLREAEIECEINPRLVRGLDYYNFTVFEWVTDRLGAQGTVCAGGRYDGLLAQLGGKPAPACGFAMGVERLLALMAAQQVTAPSPPADVYLAHQGAVADRFALHAAERLRDHGIQVIYHCGGGGFKSQMKKADHSGARYAIILGDDEAARNMLTLKPLRELGEQAQLSLEEAIDVLSSPAPGNSAAS
ncbi:MAG TPA: histidine--tRNA ligase [Betaproteobacteria bacterium]|nr:histidine--tRNA ligase [Betaproteobacteria bacterium]